MVLYIQDALTVCTVAVAANVWCVSCRIFKIKDPKFAGIAPKVCKPVEVPDEDH